MLMGTARRSDELEQSLCETRSRKGTLLYVNELSVLCPLGTTPGLTSPFYGAPGPNPGGSERLLAYWLRPFLVG